ncbi:MAG: gliding motility-associated ABC transporter permease subunit GldF [Cytophagaceae bacterium]|jgi:ABC-2 type transport system permease protein|nr:gliding motility-associated ABC transporter permease subunit GldF [Cytophagaceae bacterium]
MWPIYLKEIRSFLNSLIAYLVMMVFLTFIGLYMWVFPGTNVLEVAYADMENLFSFGPIAYLLLIPAITMKTFAEEKKDGTIELLLTKPITDLQLIGGKYLAALSLVGLALVPTWVYYFSIYQLGTPTGNIDTPAVWSSYLGLFLLGAVFTSIGIFCSSFSQNQIISFLCALVLCYVLYDGFAQASSLSGLRNVRDVIAYLGLGYHYQALSKGMIDSRNVFHFLSVIFLMLSLTKLVIGSRKW